MKLKLFFNLYGVYIMIGINVLFAWYRNMYLLPIVLIFYGLFIKTFNRKGFIDRKMMILILLYFVSIILIQGIMHYYLYASGIILFATTRLYLPHRSKTNLIFDQIELNQTMSIFYDRIVQSEKSIEFGYEISQSEMDWLINRILFMSKDLKQVHIIYKDNEIIGNNFHVNIV